MNKKEKVNYFAYFESITFTALKEAELLAEFMKNYDHKKITERMDQIHLLEHNADQKMDTMTEQLIADFLPPIDRDDISELAEKLDDICDTIDDVMLNFYMYDIKRVRSDVNKSCEGLVEITKQTNQLFSMINNFKQPKRILEKIKEISDMEDLGDEYYLESMHCLYLDDLNGHVKTAVAWNKLYQCLEKCYDSCEIVAKLLKTITIKNS